MRSTFIGRLLCPPKCVGCRKRLDVFENSSDGLAFCDECLKSWEKEKLDPCPTCRVAAVECTCRPDVLDKKYVDCISLIKFGRTERADMLIYSLKKRKIAKNFEFASSELAKRFADYKKSSPNDLTDVIFTSVPRKRSTVARVGFDHARILSEMTAKRLGYPYADLIMRSRNTKDQKKLTGKERIKNVKGSFDLLIKGSINERTVVLVDDVITTGSTAAECIKVLRGGGAKKVVLLSLSHAAEKRKAKRRQSRRKIEKKD